jgi:transcriptional regulator with XRE-family HTH domain
MTLKQLFIRNLKDFRKKEGLSQMRLADYCNISPGYIGEIESGRKFPSTEMIEKIAGVLRIEPYIFFKNPRDNRFTSGSEKQFSRLPYNRKKQIKEKIKRQVKKQIKTQIYAQLNTQIKLSTKEVLNEINEILDKY